VSPSLPRPLVDVVYPPATADTGAESSDPIHETAYTQVALFAVEYALAMLWRSWGVEPSILVGHSVGEIVAACVAGVFGVDDALRLVAARGRLMQALPKGGGMAAVKCDPATAAAHIAPFRDTLSIAAVNGPADVVLSGKLEDLDTVTERLAGEGMTVVRLRVSHAFHSPLIEPMLTEFDHVARSITFRTPTLPLVSNVTGQLAGAEVATAEYWVRHVREAVRFADGVVTASGQGVDVFLEIGPAPVLIGMGRQSVSAGNQAWLPSLRSGRSDWRQLSESLATLYARGAAIDWHSFHRHDTYRRVHLPTYPFQRQRYWIDPPAAAAATSGAPMSLLGHRLRLPGSSEVRFEARWGRPTSPTTVCSSGSWCPAPRTWRWSCRRCVPCAATTRRSSKTSSFRRR
jgi:acyl transferase domain-containing protein